MLGESHGVKTDPIHYIDCLNVSTLCHFPEIREEEFSLFFVYHLCRSVNDPLCLMRAASNVL